MFGICAPRRARGLFCQLIAVVASLLTPLAAQAALTVSPLTWNVVGLDSNSPTTGPQNFPVGARVCSTVATTNVAVNFVFDSANANVNLRPGSLSTINLAAIGAGGCADAYFEAQVTRTAAAYDTARRYHITATDGSGTYVTATPRDLYVEHLISQSRNSITDVKYGTSIPTLVSVATGGSMNLVVGNTYVIQLLGGTATQGYNQFEAFINFPNTVFQILSVNTTYSADNSPYVPGPAPTASDKLYADACLWQNDPNDPNYRACVGGDYKAGGSNVVTTYTIKIVGGGGTSQTLNTLLYDFSGSSYHYNGDFSSGARIANIIDPTSAGISKSFSPSTIPVSGVSVLSITLANSNSGALSGYNFVDNLPPNMTVANPSGASTSGCGTPTLTATAGTSTISFSNGTVAANSNCVISVNVTPSITGSLVNTTNHLFVGSIDTTHSATATLTVNNAPPPPACTPGIELARWTMDPAQGATAPPQPSYKSSLVATATALYTGSGTSAIDATQGNAVNSWSATGWAASGSPSATVGPFMDFTLDTSKFTNVKVSAQAFIASGNWAAPANNFLDIFTSANGGGYGAAILNWNLPKGSWNTIPGAPVAASSTGSATTTFRFNAVGAKTLSDPMYLDNIVFTGCGVPAFPTIAKAFAPNSIAVGATSTLTFTLVNNNGVALTGATFSDSLPAGVQVAATPGASTTCGGTWAPASGNTTLNFSGGTIPANGSCTLSVNVTATSAGPHNNVSGFLSTNETGQNPNSVASATLTAVSPPQIAKEFAPSPILPNGISTLTFTITNPNQNDALAGVAFADTFPVSPGAMVVAAAPNATTSGCGAPTFSPVAGAGSISFSGGAIAAGGTCIVSVNVTAPSAGTYNNVSGNASHVINAQTVNGNTASGSLTVNPPHPTIGLLKQVGPSATGPWTPFLDVNLPNNVYYQFTIENTGDVPLSPISLTDSTLDVSSCNATFASTTLPVAVAANNNHIVTCVGGPVSAVSGSHINTAHATGTFNAAPVNSPNSSATYATTGLTLAKSATESSFTLPGEVLHYSYLVTNNGFAPLQGPVTVSDNKTTVTCPAVSTVGDLDNFLDPGESITCTATYIVTAADVTAGSVTNTASATINGVSSNNALKTVPLSTSADVSIDKTLTTSSPYFAGQSISYTLTVANAGPSTATNIQVTDTPSNLTITNISGSGCASLPCTIASLSAGNNTQIFVTATINAAGAFDNSATATAAQPDPDPSNNTDNTNNGGTATDAVDLAVVKTFVTPGPYRNADVIQFNIAVTNNGPSTATNVMVVDHPVGLSVLSMSGGGCNGASVPGAHNQNVQCTIASMASGETQNVSVTASIDNPGQFTNDGIVSADQTDTNPANNDSQVVDIATTSADISIVKAITTPGPYYVGESITYTLTVHNAGPSPAANVFVNDTPSNMTITNVSGPTGNAFSCSSFPCQMAPAMVIGNTRVMTVTATINSTGAFSNTATANGPDFDPDPSNNTSSAGDTTSPSADLSVVKTFVTPSPYRNADVITFNIAVTNNGPDTATNVVVKDHPVGLSVLTMSGGGCTGASVPGGHNQNVQCTIASLANGATANVTVTASIDNPGQFTNDGIVSADQIDPNPTNNDSQVVDVATTSADVSVVKAITTPGPYYVGQTVTYTLTVHNAGPSPAGFVTVNDVPMNMTIQSVSVSGGGACASFPCSMTSPPFMVIGNTRTITVTATLNAVGTFDNTATANGTDFDPNPANNTSAAGGTALPAADLSLVKTLTTTGPYNPGQTISYSIVVANAGPSTATNVVVADTPNNLTITNVSGSGCAAMPCTIGSLASGANTTINVTATINGVGAFSNSASVAATEFDPNSANNTSTASATTGPAADVSVVKTLTTAGPYNPGQSINYSIVVANAGPSTATNVVVTDTPSNLTITNVSGSGCAAMPCTIASLASGANTTINVTATINAAGAFSNSAAVTATEFDPNNANNTSTAGSTAVPTADLSLVKTLTTAGPYNLGQTISYSIVIANAGPSTATNVVVADTPNNLTITNVSGSGCAAMPCTIGNLASGANTTINVTATINAAGAFSNSAAVAATEFDPNSANNTSTANAATGPAADVSVVKTLISAGPYNPGQSINYSIVVANAGPSTATNVVVTDTPSNLTITNVSGSGCAAVPCTIASLASGANTTINVTATINAAGAFDNSATATATEFDPNVANNTDNTGNGGTAGVPQLTVTKSASPTPFAVGVPGSYTITVTNTGSATTSGSILVSDALPTGITPTSASGTNWSCTGTTSLACTFTGTLTAGASTTLTLNVGVGPTATTANNSATASGGGDSTCPAAPHCTGTVTVSVVAPNLTTSKTGVLDNTVVSPSNQSNPGDRINYTITAANSGNGPATGVTVADPKLPSLSCTIGGNPTTLPATIPAAGALVCTGAYTLTSADISNTSVTNTATVSGQNVCTAPSPSCAATHVTPLVASPRLTLTKTASSNPFVIGQPASYTLTVTNSGSTATTAAISVADNLPTGITLASAVGTGWTCTGTTNLACTFAGVLNPSASATLTLNVNVGGTATTGTNTAAVSGGGDPACPAASQCSSTVVVSVVTGDPPAPVPGDARWAMWLLGLALLATAARMAERRRE